MDTTKKIKKEIYHISIDKQPPIKQKTFLGIDYDSLTLASGILVPLLSFILGFLFSILRDKFREKSDIKVTSDSFFMWIDKMLKSSNALLLELKKRKDETISLDSFQISRPDYINLHLNRLTLDQKILYKAFVKLKKGNLNDNTNDYSKIIVDIDFLDDFQKTLLQNSQYIVDDFQNLFSQWNDSIRRLHKAKHNLVGKRFREGGAKLRVVNDHFNAWYQTDEQGLSITHKFLKSLEPILQDYYKADPSDDELADLLSITQQTNVIYNQFIFERGKIQDLYEKFYNQLNETIDELNSLSQKIKSKKNKFFYL